MHIILLVVSFFVAGAVGLWTFLYATDQQAIRTQALLTPAVAFLAVWVAVAQWRIAREKLKLDVFDRRFAVYQATTHILWLITFKPTQLTQDAIREHEIAVRGAEFIFDPAVGDFLDKIHAQAALIEEVNRRIRAGAELPVENHEKRGKAASNLSGMWYSKELDKKMSRFMRLRA